MPPPLPTGQACLLFAQWLAFNIVKLIRIHIKTIKVNEDSLLELPCLTSSLVLLQTGSAWQTLQGSPCLLWRLSLLRKIGSYLFLLFIHGVLIITATYSYHETMLVLKTFTASAAKSILLTVSMRQKK